MENVNSSLRDVDSDVSNPATTTDDDDGRSLITEREFPGFKRLPTLPIAYVLIFSNIVLVLMVFVLPIFCYKEATKQVICPISPYSLLIYFHGLNWLLHLIADQYWKKHHKRSRIEGYTEFYLQVKNVRRAPFYISSIGNAVLLVATVLLEDYCDPSTCEAVDYLRGLITLEGLSIIFLVLFYAINVKEFHVKKQAPDVLREDLMNSLYRGRLPGYATRRGQTEREVRDEVLSRQAELIRYQQSHVDSLNKTIAVMSRRINSGC